MVDKKHRILRPAHGIHVVHAWEVSTLDDVSGLVQADIGKIARMERESAPGLYDFFLLVKLEINESGDIPTWLRLGSSSWVEWYVPRAGSVDGMPTLEEITPTTDDRNKIAKVDNGSAFSYWVLADVYDSEGLVTVWLRLDDTYPALVWWEIDPEGFPSSLSAITVTPSDLHHIAYDPSGTTHYWILRDVVDNGEGGYDGVWAPLDEPAPDITGKADKRLAMSYYTGTARTVTAADFDTMIRSTNAAMQTFTLSALTDDPVRSLVVWQYGTGKVRFVAGAGATIRPSGTIETTGQYSPATLSLVGPNEWLVTGDVTVS